METKNITIAIINVMKAIKGIDKSMTVGTGNSSYKGVSDKDVKQIIGEQMELNGLCLLPISVIPTVKIDRFIENTQYGEKQKQSVFTEVQTKYLLLHTSGESVEIAGYGHGIDSQDKGAGKATTYAMKYALLYTFMVATGSIDDADTTHSDNHPVPNNKPQNYPRPNNKPQNYPRPNSPDEPQKPWLNKKTPQFDAVLKGMRDGYTLAQVRQKYSVSKEISELLQDMALEPA